MTFSEKAAGELKLRLREELERARRADRRPTRTPAALLEHAVHDFEEAHVSTIHGFCAELLRERPVEARVDPAFAVLTDTQAERLSTKRSSSGCTSSWATRTKACAARCAGRSSGASTRTTRTDRSSGCAPPARSLREWRDHDAPWRRPSYDRKGAIKSLIAQLKAFADLIAKPIKRDDNLAVSLAPARQSRAATSSASGAWSATWCPRACGTDGKPRSSALAENRDFANIRRRAPARRSRSASRAIRRWPRTPSCCRTLRAFRDHADADLAALLHEEMRDCLRRYEERKQEAGALDFLDLLIKARDLVRDNTDVCREFRERFRVILVDEFQDTDPLQAELLLCLAGADDGTIRPGALFIVGDPKQSIYRFRRADVGAYRRIADRLSAKRRDRRSRCRPRSAACRRFSIS